MAKSKVRLGKVKIQKCPHCTTKAATLAWMQATAGYDVGLTNAERLSKLARGLGEAIGVELALHIEAGVPLHAMTGIEVATGKPVPLLQIILHDVMASVGEGLIEELPKKAASKALAHMAAITFTLDEEAQRQVAAHEAKTATKN